MSTLTKIMVAVVSSVFLLSPVAFAGGNLAKQKPIEVRLDMGKDSAGDHKFYPDKLTFETGKLYKLVLHNPSDSKHYFTSPDFVSRVYTRKVQVMDDLGAGAKQIGEIKGAVSEVEIYPGGTTEWWFVPVATGNATVWCHIKDKDGKTHRDKGMEGMITIL
ncbi:MAG: biphenyl 2,3-dioxygenase [Gammaproteobacteria bacterium]|nr:biphenyl 2,3-dioxygenase [Gammaproteobacteria bacterium]